MQIFIRRLTKQTITLDVEASDSTDTVLATIAKIEGCPVEQFRLEAYGPVEQFNLDSMPYPWIVPLDDGCRTMSDYGIREGEWLRLEQHFEIVIETLSGRTFTSDVDASNDEDTEEHFEASPAMISSGTQTSFTSAQAFPSNENGSNDDDGQEHNHQQTANHK